MISCNTIIFPFTVANFDPSTFSLMRCEFCGAGFDTRAGLSSHARAHLRDFGITNWELTISPINILKELLANSSEYPVLQSALGTDPSSSDQEREMLDFGPYKSTTSLSEYSILQSPFSLFPSSWGDEPLQSFRDGKQFLNLMGILPFMLVLTIIFTEQQEINYYGGCTW